MKTNIEKAQDPDQETPNVPNKPPAPKSEAEAEATMPNLNDGRVIFKSQEDFQEAVRKIMTAVDRSGPDVYEDDYTDSRQELQDDLLDEKKHLVTRSKWYQIRSYAIHGKEVMAPNGAITFNANWFYYMQGKHTITYCIAEIHRKSTWEYLKNHPLFGVVFHERQSDALSGDMAIVDKQAQALLMLSKLDPSSLERRARHYKNKGFDINMGSDSRDLIRQLAVIEGKMAHQSVQNRMKETIERSMGKQDNLSTLQESGRIHGIG